VRSASILLPKIIDLAPGGRESVLDRDLGVLVALVVRRRVAYHYVFIRRHRQQDVDLKAFSVPMVVARSDHGHPAGGNAMIVSFQLLEFTLNARTNWIRWLASLEIYLERNLHLSLSMAPLDIGNYQSTGLKLVAALNATFRRYRQSSIIARRKGNMTGVS
jgi:hypothetical protein